MNKKLITGLIVLMSISLVGIILVQLFWIRNAIEIKEKQFDRDVTSSMTNIVDRLQTNDAVMFISSSMKDQGKPVVQTLENYSFVDYGFQDSLLNDIIIVSKSENNKDLNRSEYKFIAEVSNEDDKEIFLSSTHEKNKPGYSILSFGNEFEQEIILSEEEDTVEIALISSTDKYRYRIKKINNVIKRLTWEYVTRDEPIEHRLDLQAVQDIISDEFKNKGLPHNFEFGILADSIDDSEFSFVSGQFYEIKENNVYKTSLFPDDIFNKSSSLLISFPDKGAHVRKSISILLFGSVFFTLIILTTFGVTIHIIFRQKKISEIKSDFINNMTHEFKTPIATISLAADSMTNPKVIRDKTNVSYYAGIIKEENKRMNSQVEHVLQMSLLDRNDLNLNIENYDIHRLINKAIRNIGLQLKEKNGQINTHFDAVSHYALIDEIHFTNVLYNLIDNALKYNNKEPLITIRTQNHNNELEVIIEDNGIGMSKDIQKRIFDKFFRTQTGNIHNIKGFGLGLSYVKAIINACGGKVAVKSEPAKGTRFIINLLTPDHEN